MYIYVCIFIYLYISLSIYRYVYVIYTSISLYICPTQSKPYSLGNSLDRITVLQR